MKVSEQWLREWVDPPVSTAELAAQLTMAGLEVDSVEPARPVFAHVVVGRVLEVAPHPHAERLRVCTVDAGQTEPLQIVCGAANVKVGMCVPAALSGAVLPDQQIKQSKLRGVESQGMLCSAKELGLGEDAEGLLPLPVDSIPGTDVHRWLRLNDQLIEIDLTPNRGDCLSIHGIAREVGVLNGCPVTEIPSDPVDAVIDAVFPVEIQAPADCPRYVGRVVRNVNPKAETPLWMRERLRRSGLRSLGPLVDVTNYVMLELGQPMHAFDLHKLSGGIVVRRARQGERLELLNGSEVEPDGETLVIADHAGPLALAGIMGGEASAVTDDTRDIFLESAFFTPLTISGRARRYGLHTDSSHRFERGVDPQLQARAVERATRLLLDITGGEPGPVIDVSFTEHLPIERAIRLRPGRIRRLLGLDIAVDTVSEILTGLGMAVAAEGKDWLVAPPSFRFDITIEADLIEEIGRIYGYNRMPSHQPLTRAQINPRPEGDISLARLCEVLIQRGFQEAITYSFVDPSFQKALDPQHQPIALANPISADMAVMRTSLWPGLLKTLVYNQKRQQSRVRLFEIGLGFMKDGEDILQNLRIGGVACGAALPEQWGMSTRELDFFDLKGDVEALLALTGQPEAFAFVAAGHPALHPGQAARIEREDSFVGWIGALHPSIGRKLDLEGGAFVFELHVDGIRQAQVPRFTELSKFPAIRRDIAVVVDEQISVQAVQDCIGTYGGELLREVHLFDLYHGKGIPEDRKSLAFGLILQDFSRTLTDYDVDEIISNIVSGLKQQLSATLRV